MIKVFIERTKERKTVEARTVKEALNKLKVNSQTVIVTRDNELLTGDDKLKKGDEIKLLSVISGG